MRKTPPPPPKVNLGQMIDQMGPGEIREINQQLTHYQIKPKSAFQPTEGQ